MKSSAADFPDWFGPMLVKELRQGLKTRGFVFSFVGLQLVLIFVLIYHVLLYSQGPGGFDPRGLGAIYWGLIGGLLLIVTPLRAFNELAAERKANTLELIFMSGLSAWRITFGKWVSLLFQSLLFVLAVLPYAILRYYFGGVDLAADLSSILLVMLLCAVLSAMALAISGFPLWARIILAILALLTLLPTVPALIFTQIMPGASGGMGFDLADLNWWVISYDVVLVCLIALQIGAASVSPLAENHSGRQRGLALLLWLPIPFMIMRGATDNAVLPQLFLFSGAANLLLWYHFSMRPLPLHSYAEPFAGWRAILGVPFQPGWPSALIFLMLEGLLFVGTVLQILRGHSDRSWLLAGFIMGAASLLCSTLVWVAIRPKARYPLILETVFTILCGVAVALILAGKPSSVYLGELYFFAILPSMGIWAMLDHDYRGSIDFSENGDHWFSVSLIAFGVYALILLALSSKYWVQYFRLCWHAAHPRKPAVEAPAAAQQG